MKPSRPTARPIPTFRSAEEAAEYWDTHSTTEFEGEWGPVAVEVVRPLGRTWFVTIELDAATFERLRAEATRRGMRADDLAKTWLLERLARASEPGGAD
jgi:CopG antitoxin of type II toxin-antitoxin system